MFSEDGKLVWAAQYHTWGAVHKIWQADNDNDICGPYPPPTRGNLAFKYDTVEAQAAQNCPIRFQGQWADEETGLYYNRFRYYDPLIGQYISRDPLGINGGLQSYAYVNIPTGWVDPLGLYGVYIFQVQSQGKCYVGKGNEVRFVTSMLFRSQTKRTGSSKGNRKAGKNACPRGWYSDTDRIANALGENPKDFGAMVENRLINHYGANRAKNDWFNAKVDGGRLYNAAKPDVKAAADAVANSISAKFGSCN